MELTNALRVVNVVVIDNVVGFQLLVAFLFIFL